MYCGICLTSLFTIMYDFMACLIKTCHFMEKYFSQNFVKKVYPNLSESKGKECLMKQDAVRTFTKR
jgi:hypothetical protein